MVLEIISHNSNFSSSPQISAEDINKIVALGFKTIINNRPDHEGGADQPTNDSIRIAAEKAGLHYSYIPVIPNNITAENIRECTSFISNCPSPILGFCRTGNRATKLYIETQK